MTSSRTTDAAQAEVAQDAQPPAAPMTLDLLGDANAGSCCGGSCALPGA